MVALVDALQRKVKELERRLIDLEEVTQEPDEVEQPTVLDYGLDYDYLYVGVKKITPDTRTTNFLKIYLDGTTTPEWVESMPEGDQDADAVVIDVTKRRIYLNGEVAG